MKKPAFKLPARFKSSPAPATPDLDKTASVSEAPVPESDNSPAIKPESKRRQPKLPKSPKRPKAKLPKLISSRRLMATALREWRSNWKPYTKIIALVLVPSIIVAQFSNVASSATMRTNISAAAVFMSLAITWAFVQQRKTGRVPNVPEAYYRGTASFLRYALVGLALLIFLIPFSLGLGLYAIAIIVAETTGVYGVEQILVGFVALVLSMPSFFLIVRYGLAPYSLVYDDLRPIAALRAARHLTLGRFWPVAGRLAMLPVFLALFITPVVLITIGFALLKLPQGFAIFVQSLFLLAILPIANLYLFQLYRWLEDIRSSTPESATPAATEREEAETSGTPDAEPTEATA